MELAKHQRHGHRCHAFLRLQVARDQSRNGEADNQVWLQYIMSLGAHGAHKF